MSHYYETVVLCGGIIDSLIPTGWADLNPSVPIKLTDRGSFQAVSLVIDAASFLSELVRTLGRRP